MGLRVQRCRRGCGSSCRPWRHGLPETDRVSLGRQARQGARASYRLRDTKSHRNDQNGCVTNSCEGKKKKEVCNNTSRQWMTACIRLHGVGQSFGVSKSYHGCRCHDCICIINMIHYTNERSMHNCTMVCAVSECCL